MLSLCRKIQGGLFSKVHVSHRDFFFFLVWEVLCVNILTVICKLEFIVLQKVHYPSSHGLAYKSQLGTEWQHLYDVLVSFQFYFLNLFAAHLTVKQPFVRSLD